jgi:hypothetical protein
MQPVARLHHLAVFRDQMLSIAETMIYLSLTFHPQQTGGQDMTVTINSSLPQDLTRF